MSVRRGTLEIPEETDSGLSRSKGRGRLLGAWREGLRLFGGAATPGDVSYMYNIGILLGAIFTMFDLWC
jgi:hypothetical protein